MFCLSFEPKFSLSQAVPRQLDPIPFWLFHAIGDSGTQAPQRRGKARNLQVNRTEENVDNGINIGQKFAEISPRGRRRESFYFFIGALCSSVSLYCDFGGLCSHKEQQRSSEICEFQLAAMKCAMKLQREKTTILICHFIFVYGRKMSLSLEHCKTDMLHISKCRATMSSLEEAVVTLVSESFVSRARVTSVSQSSFVVRRTSMFNKQESAEDCVCLE